MNEPTAYEIVVRGRPSERLLRPLLDDFTAAVDDGRVRLTGVVRDASHLHGIVAHLTSVNVEIVRVSPSPAGSTDVTGPDLPTDPKDPTERSTS